MDRRSFLKVIQGGGAALVLAVSLPRCSPGEKARFDEASGNLIVGAMLEIGEDDRITVVVPKPEMGQGVRHGLAMLVAEELDAAWSRVDLKQAPFDERFGDQQVSGSYSVIALWQPMRQAGAAAREMIVRAAAKKWGVSDKEIEISEGTVRVAHDPQTKTSLGALARAAAEQPIPKSPVLKDPKAFKLIGTSVPNPDLTDIVRGTQAFGLDTRRPNLRYAVIVRCPYFDGELESHDPATAQGVPGVHSVVPLSGRSAPNHMSPGVAVVADTTWAAMQGAKALVVTWKPANGAKENSGDLATQFEKRRGEPGITVHESGNAQKALSEGRETVEAVYTLPFLAHAPMEPMNCTAIASASHCEIWAPTQSPGWAARAVSEALGLPLKAITVNVIRMGGAFGRRVNPDFVLEAAILARETGQPIQVVWRREDDMRHGFFRPSNIHLMQGVLDSDGKPEALHHHLFSSSISSTYNGVGHAAAHEPESHGSTMDLPYAIANRRFAFSELHSVVRQGWWRSVAYSYNIFAVESFIDELAIAANKDPLAFRLDLLASREAFSPNPNAADQVVDPGRQAAVLRLAAEKAGWGAELPAGAGRGIAACWYYTSRTYTAAVVDVRADEEGRLSVDRVVIAADCGIAIHPDTVRAQLEGSVVYGLSAALFQRITLRNGTVEQANFDSYPALRFSQTPPIEVHLVPSAEAPGGIGEPGLPPVAPALANAVFAATGHRHRELPIPSTLG
ncbi:Xanthine dehydrogenase family protein molybdopterin-binding subunit [Sulfidibacter corallicola]|uniref:Xanthine dehydrogenase family protein molybdopterin-binding subunit n=1 Tax=Sulfidibacter corallicola TaxID=2818388 RepID=A0A8A4TEW7_SULCO|nr:molybdopterin cofactor-binding domain-containing protein [Sulfidibacter corallicola]QTD48080.1 xanthine dehydrogenase family protein molybdopterin-binding subunit [Sulfidibacter corallicola]